ncbi:progesterone binding protein [Amylocystis lapponica]|nr:progesterone binding protein [Amylocystis lapponica]
MARGTSTTTLFSPPNPNLKEPKTRHFSAELLASYDGTNTDEIYIAIRGIVFDVTEKSQLFGPGRMYAEFAGRDASRAWSKMTKCPEDLIASCEGLTAEQVETLDLWLSYFK